jgi:hypothetical protein
MTRHQSCRTRTMKFEPLVYSVLVLRFDVKVSVMSDSEVFSPCMASVALDCRIFTRSLTNLEFVFPCLHKSISPTQGTLENVKQVWRQRKPLLTFFALHSYVPVLFALHYYVRAHNRLKRSTNQHYNLELTQFQFNSY